MMKREDVGYGVNERYFASNCPSKVLIDNDITQNKITEPDIPTILDEPLKINLRIAPTLRMVNFENVDTNGTSKCVFCLLLLMIGMFYACVTPVLMSIFYHTI